MIFVCSATHKTKSMFFFIAQTEQGDVFKITLETDEDMVRAERVQGYKVTQLNSRQPALDLGLGIYCSYLLPRQDDRTSKIIVNMRS